MMLQTSSTTTLEGGLPSPTLTNPDMILPYDTPYDDFDLDQTTPPSMRAAESLSLAFSSHPVIFTHHARTLTPPNTAIIYGRGTMLSDIDELESVAESTPKRNSTADFPMKSERNSIARGSSPTVPDEQRKLVAAEFRSGRRLSSSDSNESDIDLAGYAAEFEGF